MKKMKLTPVALLLTGIFLQAAQAEDLYFPVELVAGNGQDVADLSHFKVEGNQLPGKYQVEIYLNNNFVESRSLAFLSQGENTHADNDIRDNTGLIACLTRQDLDKLGVKLALYPELMTQNESQCISPGKYIPGAYTAFNFQKMRLDISIPQATLHQTARGYIEPDQWDEGINAALLNYSFSGSNSQGQYGDNNSYYLNLNGGLNLGPWRLRDYRIWNYYDSQYGHQQRWQHLQTYAERTIVPLRSELTLGESSTASDIFDSLGFRGVQLATADAMYPETMRGFAPVIRGTADTNAQVSIRQNGYNVYQTFVPPGPFEINDLYPMYSSGDLVVSVKEADGRVQTFTVPYSSVPLLQREGRVKYNLVAGRFKGSSSSYDDPTFTQGSIQWGLPHDVTAYGGAQYAANYFATLLGAGISLGSFGAVSADVTQANSTLADNSQHRGQSMRVLYSHDFSLTDTSLRLVGSRYSTRGFYTLDETALQTMHGRLYDHNSVDEYGQPTEDSSSVYDYYNLGNSRRARMEASISQHVGKMGSLYLTGVRQTYWDNPIASNSLQAGFNSRLGSINYSLAYGYTRQGQRNAPAIQDQTVSLSLSMPLDSLLPGPKKTSSTYATFNASRDNHGAMSQQAGLNGSTLENRNLSWSVSQRHARSVNSTTNGGSASASYRGSMGNANAGYSVNGDNRQYSYGVSGGALLHSNGLTLGQQINGTGVLISAAGASQALVRNEQGVKTDYRGYAIKPGASDYRENRVELDTRYLDDNTELQNSVTRVIPTKDAIVRASFTVHSGRRVIATLMRGGKPLPFGTMVSAGDNTGIVGDEGQVYLSGMADEGQITATWGSRADQTCTLDYRLPAEEKDTPVTKISATCGSVNS